MKMIPVMIIIGVLIFSGYCAIEIGTMQIKSLNQKIETNLLDIEK